MKHNFRENWHYFFLTPLLLTALLNVFLAENSIQFLDLSVLLTYVVLILIGLFIGCIMVFSNAFIRAVFTTTLIFFLVISQIKVLPSLPYGLKYRYLIPLIIVFFSYILYYFRSHLNRLLLIFFGTLWLGSLFTPKNPFIAVQNFASVSTDMKSDLPPYIEIVLDEHIGLEGIASKNNQQDFIDEIKKNYIDTQGFRVYGKAFSRDFRSIASFASFLNFKPIDDLHDYITKVPDDDRHVITQNALFEMLSNKGYAVNVIQSSYLDLCKKSNNINLSKCMTYKHTALVPADFVFNSSEKTIVLLEKIFSILHFDLTKIKESQIWSLLGLPELNNQSVLAPSTATYQAFNEVEKLANSIKPNNAYFIHLLLPHSPYVFNENCDYVGENSNKDKAYFAQLKCTHKLLNGFLSKLDKKAKNSIIVVHGDHGSRIEEPDIRLNYKFTTNNIIKNYSTFFMIKSTFNPPGYDLTLLPLDFLLKNVLSKIEAPISNDIKRTIYVRSGRDFDLGKKIMPNFLNGAVYDQASVEEH